MIAIIPARSGSKELPGKNIKLLNGEPLIKYTIEAALNSKSITRVIVSTDSKDIAKIAIKCGAEVPFLRPSELASDGSMVLDVYHYTIKRLIIEELMKIKSFVSLLPTVPLRNSYDIDCAVDIYNSNKIDGVISVYEAPQPIYWHRKLSEEGYLVDYMSDFDAVKNRQLAPKTYLPNGGIYIFNYEYLNNRRDYYGGKILPYVMPRERSVDIDNLIDFEYVEYLVAKI